MSDEEDDNTTPPASLPRVLFRSKSLTTVLFHQDEPSSESEEETIAPQPPSPAAPAATTRFSLPNPKRFLSRHASLPDGIKFSFRRSSAAHRTAAPPPAHRTDHLTLDKMLSTTYEKNTRRKSRHIDGLDAADLQALIDEQRLNQQSIMEADETFSIPQSEDLVMPEEVLEHPEPYTVAELDQMLQEMPQHVVVLLLRASNLPRLNVAGAQGRRCDPYCKAWATDAFGQRAGPDVRWPVKPKTQSPVWNSAREVGVKDDSLCLHLEIWHRDQFLDDFIGEIDIAIKGIELDKPFTVPLHSKMAQRQNTTATVTLMLLSQKEDEKLLFVIRHGESKWNRAMMEKDIYALLSSTDHPLNERGVAQAEQLQQTVLREQFYTNSGQLKDPLIEDFINAEVVFSSPLTRAIQTALISTTPILHKLERLVLMPNAREKRNLGGQDSSGKVTGQAIRDRAMAELAKVGYKPEIFRDLGISIDTDEVDHHWWDSIKESKIALQQRLDEFMNQIRWLPQNRIILVGHSHFFREIFRNYLHPSFALSNPELASNLCSHVIENCGVACLKLDFFYERMVMDVELMFESRLVKKVPRKLPNFEQSARIVKSVFTSRSRVRPNFSDDKLVGSESSDSFKSNVSGV
eukprot:c5188_g1_i1.p1 GENE.c5188_g1_i1~~c5188_g1_i1.p1  ORF type:complete len:632 (+),score=159.57 c5188_g1_i1:25-1920(+)